MSDSDFIMWNKDGEWLAAPYNDGAGGSFNADPDTIGLFKEYTQNHASLESNTYYLFHDDTRVTPLIRLRKKDLRFKGGNLQVHIEEPWLNCRCPGLDEREQNALFNDTGAIISCTSDKPPTLIWLNDGGRDQWLKIRDETKAKEEEQEAERAIKARHDNGNHFINPYTFVPLPDQISRSKPMGHEVLEPRGLSGWFTWQLTFKTPLVYPIEDLPTTKDGSICYPGSALRGALRNLHESLTGSCMRILDDEYLPVHREPMSVGTQEHRLAVVREVDPITGAVRKVEPTKDLSWVKESVIHRVISADELRSGSLVNLNTENRNYASYAKRYEIKDENAASTGKNWVLHLSEAGARPKPDKEHPNRSYFIAAGRLAGEQLITITPENWEQFKLMCAGSKDMTGENNSRHNPSGTPGSEEWDWVEYQKSLGEKSQCIGRRHRANAPLSEGHTVWLDANNRLKLATIWRYPGEYSVGDRMNKDFKPCHDPQSLCPSCAVFGSVDTRTPDDKNKGAGEHSSVEQAGYASHVRVGWAYSTTKPLHKEVDIAPLRSPKPSSGGFYLIHSGDHNEGSFDDDHIPHAHWGSDSDKTKPRMIRGRKYYWHGQADNKTGTTRQKRRSSQVNDGQVTIAAEGLVLEAKVSFDNLSRKQLGWLLSAADPGTFFNTMNSTTTQKPEYWIHLGRGKPLGYGSAKPEIINLHIQTAQERYGAKENELVTAQELIETVSSHAPDRLRNVHKALERVLAAHPRHVAADRIWYPTTGNFKNKDNPKKNADFDKSFEWFAGHSGGRPSKVSKNEALANDLCDLPDAMKDDQYLWAGRELKPIPKDKKNNHGPKGRGRR